MQKQLPFTYSSCNSPRNTDSTLTNCPKEKVWKTALVTKSIRPHFGGNGYYTWVSFTNRLQGSMDLEAIQNLIKFRKRA